MFSKVALLALVTPLVAGLTLQIPQNPTSGGTVTIVWTSAAGDPSTFTLELVNDVFHNSFAIANNVQPTTGQITIELPSVPVGAGYTLEAVDIGNIGNVYSTTGTFSIGPNAASTGVTTSTTGTGTGTGTSTVKGTSSVTSPVVATTATTTGFGSTVPNSLSSLATTSGTSTSAASAATTSNAAMAPLKINSNIGAFSAVLFSAIAGAAIVAL